MIKPSSGSDNHEPSSDELDSPPEQKQQESDLVEAEFIERDDADREIPYQYSIHYQNFTDERVSACTQFFDSRRWKHSDDDLRELRRLFYELPDLTSHDLLRLLQHDLRELPSHKPKPAKRNKFDKAYHAKKITNVRSFISSVPVLVSDFLGPGHLKDDRWQWQWPQEELASEAYAHLMERFVRRKMEQVSGELGRLSENPHQDPFIEDAPHDLAITRLIESVKMPVFPQRIQPNMNKCKLSTVNLFCDLLGVDNASVYTNVASAEREDQNHLPPEIFVTRDLGIHFIPSNLWFYCTAAEVEYPHFWSHEALKESKVYDEYHTATGLRHPSELHSLYLVFRRDGLLFIMYSSTSGYEGLGGTFIGGTLPAGYVIEPLKNWILFNIHPPVEE